MGGSLPSSIILLFCVVGFGLLVIVCCGGIALFRGSRKNHLRRLPIVYVCRPSGTNRIGFVLREDFEKKAKEYWRFVSKQSPGFIAMVQIGETNGFRIQPEFVYSSKPNSQLHSYLMTNCFLQAADFVVPNHDESNQIEECLFHFFGKQHRKHFLSRFLFWKRH